jgi:Mg-chelatase subunit ChlD
MFSLLDKVLDVFRSDSRAVPKLTHKQSRCHDGYNIVRKVIMGADRIGLVGFNDNGFVMAKPAEAYCHWLQERTTKLHERISGSSTNITDGLRKSIEMLQKTPPGILRRIWLLTDGYPNLETDQIYCVVDEARQAYININTIGFGDRYDEALLRRISGATHNGKFIPVASLRELTDALVKAGGNHNQSHRHHHRAECAVIAIDLSGSMTESMGGKRKIDIVEEAILHLLHYKQQCFSYRSLH